jgi:hypothetical protein
MRCPTCGRKMRYNKHGAYYHCCGWQIITGHEVLNEDAIHSSPPSNSFNDFYAKKGKKQASLVMCECEKHLQGRRING